MEQCLKMYRDFLICDDSDQLFENIFLNGPFSLTINGHIHAGREEKSPNKFYSNKFVHFGVQMVAPDLKILNHNSALFEKPNTREREIFVKNRISDTYFEGKVHPLLKQAVIFLSTRLSVQTMDVTSISITSICSKKMLSFSITKIDKNKKGGS